MGFSVARWCAFPWSTLASYDRRVGSTLRILSGGGKPRRPDDRSRHSFCDKSSKDGETFQFKCIKSKKHCHLTDARRRSLHDHLILFIIKLRYVFAYQHWSHTVVP